MVEIIKNKFFKKTLALWVIFLLVFNPFISAIALAEEVTLDPTLSPALTSSITTGDAESQTVASTEANTNITNTSGTVTPNSGCNPPEISVDCQGTDSINNQNQADTTSENNSFAQTGQNSSSGNDGGVNLNTGDATASAETTNQINTNIVELKDEASESAKIEEATFSGEFSITNVNDAKSQNEMNVSAGTGENLANENQGNAVINSGDALAIGNMFNFINTNIVGSNVEILVLNLTSQQGDINLFQVWNDLAGSFPDDQLVFAGNTHQDSLNVLIENQNQAEINNNIQVQALSGKNEADGNGTVNLRSGEAGAIANAVNVVNTNMAGSRLLFVIVNVLGSYAGNLILPRREYFEASQSLSQISRGSAENENVAVVNNDVEAFADSGGNQMNNNENSSLRTGNATAVSRNLSFLNLNLSGNGWLNVLINSLGSQTGSVLGWSGPEANEEQGDISLYSTQTQSNDLPVGDGAITQVQNFNKVKINNQISAEAISGQNQTNNNGVADMTTGGAKALVNLLNLANLNILGSNLFFGAINILGDWQGDTIFAYPDVIVSISGPDREIKPGEEVGYTVNFKNQGFDDAHNVAVVFDVPKGAGVISDSSGVIPELSGKNLKWQLGNLSTGQSESFEVWLKIDPDLSPDDLLSFWDKIISTAYAAEEGRREQVIAQATVSTSDPQLNSRNDSSTASTTILFVTPTSIRSSQSSDDETNLPVTKLEIKAKNNVNGFVYQGDVITFELEVKNTGGEIAKNVTVSQDIYDGQPESTGSVDFPLGDIMPGKVVTVIFGIQVTGLTPDSYHSIAQASGDNISANEAWTYFDIKENGINLIPEVSAQEKNQDQTGDVKGIQVNPGSVKARKEWWPYILAAMFATLWFLEVSRRKEWNLAVINKLKEIKKIAGK